MVVSVSIIFPFNLLFNVSLSLYWNTDLTWSASIYADNWTFGCVWFKYFTSSAELTPKLFFTPCIDSIEFGLWILNVMEETARKGSRHEGNEDRTLSGIEKSARKWPPQEENEYITEKSPERVIFCSNCVFILLPPKKSQVIKIRYARTKLAALFIGSVQSERLQLENTKMVIWIIF